MTINVMLSASQARAKTRNELVVFNEVRDLEHAILTAVETGEYSSIVLTGTIMTGAVPDGLASELADVLITESGLDLLGDELDQAIIYYNVWQGITSNRAKEIQMNTVIQYFTDLGYQIERRTNTTTGNTFKWVIYW